MRFGTKKSYRLENRGSALDADSQTEYDLRAKPGSQQLNMLPLDQWNSFSDSVERWHHFKMISIHQIAFEKNVVLASECQT